MAYLSISGFEGVGRMVCMNSFASWRVVFGRTFLCCVSRIS